MALADGDKIHVEITVLGTLAALGGEAQNTATPLHYRRTAFPANINLANVITAFHAACKAEWKAAASVSWSWEKTVARVIDSPTEFATEIAVAEAGGVAGDMTPSFVAFVLSKRTVKRGRSFMGRCFVPGVAESSTTGNAQTAGSQVLTDALAVQLSLPFTDADGNSFVPCVLSRVLSDLEADPSDVEVTDIASVVARSVLGRQISRRSTVS